MYNSELKLDKKSTGVSIADKLSNKQFEDVQGPPKAYVLENNNWSEELFNSSATFGSYRTSLTPHPLPEKFAGL